MSPSRVPAVTRVLVVTGEGWHHSVWAVVGDEDAIVAQVREQLAEKFPGAELNFDVHAVRWPGFDDEE